MRNCGVPFNQVQEGQENRGNNLQDSWIYTSSIAGQEIEGTVEVIVAPLPGWLLKGTGLRTVPGTVSQSAGYEGRLLGLTGLWR